VFVENVWVRAATRVPIQAARWPRKEGGEWDGKWERGRARNGERMQTGPPVDPQEPSPLFGFPHPDTPDHSSRMRPREKGSPLAISALITPQIPFRKITAMLSTLLQRTHQEPDRSSMTGPDRSFPTEPRQKGTHPVGHGISRTSPSHQSPDAVRPTRTKTPMQK